MTDSTDFDSIWSADIVYKWRDFYQTTCQEGTGSGPGTIMPEIPREWRGRRKFFRDKIATYERIMERMFECVKEYGPSAGDHYPPSLLLPTDLGREWTFVYDLDTNVFSLNHEYYCEFEEAFERDLHLGEHHKYLKPSPPPRQSTSVEKLSINGIGCALSTNLANMSDFEQTPSITLARTLYLWWRSRIRRPLKIRLRGNPASRDLLVGFAHIVLSLATGFSQGFALERRKLPLYGRVCSLKQDFPANQKFIDALQERRSPSLWDVHNLEREYPPDRGGKKVELIPEVLSVFGHGIDYFDTLLNGVGFWFEGHLILVYQSMPSLKVILSATVQIIREGGRSAFSGIAFSFSQTILINYSESFGIQYSEFLDLETADEEVSNANGGFFVLARFLSSRGPVNYSDKLPNEILAHIYECADAESRRSLRQASRIFRYYDHITFNTPEQQVSLKRRNNDVYIEDEHGTKHFAEPVIENRTIHGDNLDYRTCVWAPVLGRLGQERRVLLDASFHFSQFITKCHALRE